MPILSAGRLWEGEDIEEWREAKDALGSRPGTAGPSSVSFERVKRVGALVGASVLAVSLLMGGGVAHAQTAGGYRMMGADGGIFDFGSARFEGAGSPGTCPISMNTAGCVAFAATPSGNGYWEVSAYPATVTAFGDAQSYGQPADYYDAHGYYHAITPSAAAIVPTVDGHGYWVAMFDGTVFAYGDADPSIQGYTVAPGRYVVGAARTADGQGLWVLQSDGGVFSFGDARFYGSTGATRLNRPVVGMAATPDGGGYWLVASDGGIFSFGDGRFFGSTGNLRLNQPVVGMASTSSGAGYWLVASDGGIFTFGDAPFLGSTGAIRLTQPIVAISAG